MLQENSALTEVMCKMLVLELKQDRFMLTVESEDEDFESEERRMKQWTMNVKAWMKNTMLETQKVGA